ncbi:MAG: diacylglycerol kinase family protein [Phycisphaeraceae bacterium]
MSKPSVGHKWSLGRRVAGLRDAGRGLWHVLCSEPHAQIHAAATVVVVALCLWLEIEAWRWAAVLLAIGLVWVAELLNSALERMCDAVHPEPHSLIGRAKDAAAAAVLVASVVAVGVGVVVLV